MKQEHSSPESPSATLLQRLQEIARIKTVEMLAIQFEAEITGVELCETGGRGE